MNRKHQELVSEQLAAAKDALGAAAAKADLTPPHLLMAAQAHATIALAYLLTDVADSLRDLDRLLGMLQERG